MRLRSVSMCHCLVRRGAGLSGRPAIVAHLNVQRLVSQRDVAKRHIPELSICVHLLLAQYSFLASYIVIIYFTIVRHVSQAHICQHVEFNLLQPQ